MSDVFIFDILQNTSMLFLKIFMPIAIISLLIGLLVSFFQAVTQLQDVTLSFVPKIVAVFASLMFFAPYMNSELMDFTREILASI